MHDGGSDKMQITAIDITSSFGHYNNCRSLVDDCDQRSWLKVGIWAELKYEEDFVNSKRATHASKISEQSVSGF